MASFNFGLLELADGESGEAAVSVVVAKAKAKAKAEAEAAHAKQAEAEASAATGADKEKAALKNHLYFHKLQHDNGIRSIDVELKRLRRVLINLRGEEKKLKEITHDGRHLIQLSKEQRELRLKQNLRGEGKKLKEIGHDGCHLIQLSKEQRELRLKQLSEEQRKFRQQQKKLREEEAKLKQQQKEFYLEHGFLAGDGEESQVGDHKPEEMVISDVGSEAEQKPEEKVTSDASFEAQQKRKAATPANADVGPGATPAYNLQDGSGRRKNTLSGSQKRKKRNAAKKNGGNEVDEAKKQDSSEANVSKKTDKEPLADNPREEEKRQNWLLGTLQSWLLPHTIKKRWFC